MIVLMVLLLLTLLIWGVVMALAVREIVLSGELLAELEDEDETRS